MATQLLVKQPDKVLLCDGTPSVSPHVKATYPGNHVAADSGGRHVAIAGQGSVTVLDTATQKKVCELPVSNVTKLQLSPAGGFVVTVQRVNKETNQKNLKVWRVADGALQLELHHRPKDSDGPTVEFTRDDGLALHMFTNTVHAYNTADFAAGPCKKLHVKGIANFSVNPAPGGAHVAVFVPEVKGSPAHVALYPTASLKSDKAETPTALARKAFFRANAVRFQWNCPGSAVLALAVSDVDVTNQSYYGEQKLHFLATDGTDATLNLPKDGPIYDVQWSPEGDCFVVVAGFMPAKPVLYNNKCKALFEFAAGPYNMVRWNAFSRFLALAGFGNLPGDVAFFSKAKDGKCVQLGSVRAENGVTLEWSPTGRHVLVATVAPRLRVDNSTRCYKYDGSLLAKVPYDVLLDASYIPAAPGTFEDRPPSPGARKATAAAVGGPAATAAAAAPSSYIPPYLRGRPNAAALAAGNFNLGRDPNDLGNRVPGSAPAPVSKSAAKNAKRRAKKAADGAAGGAEDDPASTQEETTAATAVQAVTEAEGEAPASSAADVTKRIRALNKKLQQIEALKQKQSSGQALDPDQVKKISTEGPVKQEVQQLEAQLQQLQV